MQHTIETATTTLTASLVTRTDSYSTRTWIIQLSQEARLTRSLKIEIAKAFGMIIGLASFRSMTPDGLLTMTEDLMN